MADNQSMFVFSCISGGYFVSQSAILTILLESLNKSEKTNKNIDFYFGNSGGAISNLISTQYSGEKETIERVLYSIKNSMFLSNWVSGNVPFSNVSSKLIAMFKSSFYTQGKGSKNLLNTFYTSRQLKETELWIGKFNLDKSKTDLLCTSSQANSKLSTYINSDYMTDLSNVFEIKYADGDKDIIADSLNATSSLPGFKPPLKIGKYNYMDGGLGSASTGSLLLNSIKRYSQQNNDKKYQFFYVMGPNYSEFAPKPESHWAKELTFAVNQLTRSLIYRERQQIFETWMNIISVSDISGLVKITVTGQTQIRDFFNEHGSKHFFATCYTKDKKLNILNFDKGDLKTIFEETYNSVYFEIYYKN